MRVVFPKGFLSDHDGVRIESNLEGSVDGVSRLPLCPPLMSSNNTHLLVNPITSTGVARFVVVPSPSLHKEWGLCGRHTLSGHRFLKGKH